MKEKGWKFKVGEFVVRGAVSANQLREGNPTYISCKNDTKNFFLKFCSIPFWQQQKQFEGQDLIYILFSRLEPYTNHIWPKIV